MGKCAGSTVRNLALWRTRGYGSAGRWCPHLVECFFTLDTVDDAVHVHLLKRGAQGYRTGEPRGQHAIAATDTKESFAPAA